MEHFLIYRYGQCLNFTGTIDELASYLQKTNIDLYPYQVFALRHNKPTLIMEVKDEESESVD